MIGERIYKARKVAGLTLAELGAQIGVSHTAIQKFEKGILTPNSAQLLALAKACGIRTEYFFRTHTVELIKPEFRKRVQFGITAQEKILIRATEQAERRVKLLGLYPSPPITPFRIPEALLHKIENYEQIEEFSETLRNEWLLGMDQITDLYDTLEANGIFVIMLDEKNSAFDGLMANVCTNDGSIYPLIAVSKHWPSDRQRFTLAHELGHILLSGRLGEELEIEKACNRFAGAFLVPKPAIIQTLGKQRSEIEWHELYTLKHEYGLSMGGWLIRANQCGVITKSVYDSHYIRFSKKGWRTCEPGEALPQEQPKLFEQLVFRALGESLITESAAATLLGIPLMTLYRQRQLEPEDDSAHQ
ncbi:MAG: ImmA/IrrE family metallo-endopeptidase [Chlorobiaceae bacterium]|nr:ImmA/IrrE family metallo-endopeptidase [Chlorobiaceae bacterium]